MLKWLATSPVASFLKIAAGAALGGVLSWLATANIGPLWIAVGCAVLPIAINALNPDDPRYGRGQQPHYLDQASRDEFVIEGEQ